MGDPMVHLDLNPANIMLDDNMVPKITNCGFSRFFRRGQTRKNTRSHVGTRGYMPPEYLYKGEISTRFDIYSLGIIILEIITRKKNNSKRGEHDGRSFIDDIRENWTEERILLEYPEIEDEDEDALNQLCACLHIALQCVNVDQEKRPTIAEILRDVDELPTEPLDVGTQPLDVHPAQLGLPFRPNKLMSCLLQLTNKKDEMVAARLVTENPQWYMAKMPLCCVVPPKSTYTLALTRSKQWKPSSGKEFLTLESSIVSERDIIGLNDASPDSAATEFNKFFKQAKEADAGQVYELKLDVVSDPLEETDSGQQLQRSEIEIIAGRKFSHVLSVDMHPMEPWILTSNHAGEVVIWDYEEQEIVRSFGFTENPVFSAKFIEQKKWIVAGDGDGDGHGTIYVYSYDTGKKVKIINKAHKGDITSLDSHSTDPLVLSSSDDNLIRLWDWNNNWKCTQTFEGHMDRVKHLNFNPKDTNSFATASLDHKIKIWNISSPESKITLSSFHSDRLLCLHSYTSDARQYLIAGTWDGAAQIWDIETRRCIQTLKGHVSSTSCVYHQPELTKLFTGSHDGTVRQWNSTTYELENIFGVNLGAVYALGYIKKLGRIVVGCHKGMAIVECKLP